MRILWFCSRRCRSVELGPFRSSIVVRSVVKIDVLMLVVFSRGFLGIVHLSLSGHNELADIVLVNNELSVKPCCQRTTVL